MVRLTKHIYSEVKPLVNAKVWKENILVNVRRICVARHICPHEPIITYYSKFSYKRPGCLCRWRCSII